MRPFDDTFARRTHLVPIADQIGLAAIGPDHFRSRFNQGNVYHALFGGQVVGQALAAAGHDVAPDRTVHSCHAYFLRAGNDDLPVDYRVERLRDGRRFSSRRVTATQDGKVLLTLDCSYRVPLSSFAHQAPQTVTGTPENAMEEAEILAASDAGEHDFLREFLSHYPIELRIPALPGFTRRGTESRRHYWLRSRFPIASDDPRVHEAAFAYLSDFMLAGVPLVTHMVALPGPHVSVASLDHAIWFHRPLRADEWLLFETESPNANGGVNLARALVYDRTGQLVASIAQEALQLPSEGHAS